MPSDDGERLDAFDASARPGIELDTRIPSGHRIRLKIDGPGMLDWMADDSLRPWWDIVFGKRPPPEGEATAAEAADMAAAAAAGQGR